MTARHRDDLPGDGREFAWYAGLMAAAAGEALAATILERLATARPSWQQDAACRDHNEISWFERGDVKAARAVCATCPVQAPCRDYGRRQAVGVWGGTARGLRAARHR